MSGFDKQKIFRARYMVGNSRSSWEYRRHNKKNMGQENLLMVKNKWDKNYCIVFLWSWNQICESPHFLSYDYHAANLSISSRFNHKL